MMTSRSRYKGFASLDALASIVPLLLMLLLLWQATLQMADGTADRMQRQSTFNRLVSIADYTVKSGAVVRGEGIRYPNWIDESLLTEAYASALKEEAGLEELTITLGGPGEGICIYRLVVSGEGRQIRKLSVCGG